ncbi:2'-5' RNA ligase family protein [Massilia atriviolacea]|uniref:2'-5' RNA ligase family protein n=1 Tax=Massilia atriviolacea TaxID=2495579 RepID=A0A430HMT9_9BURK|nr:2'-5' RNA ligase family protein [Massilia atriviolacea]RSZ58877.1 hypothetical protein EJB06_11070 [Massilia atriviolacea]
MNWISLRNRLRTDELTEVHECALVLSVDQTLVDHVTAQRHRFGTDDVIARQLDPHITLLYGGFQPPEVLRQLETLATELAPAQAEFQVSSVGTFTNRNGFVTNVHFRVESGQLHDLHMRALHRYAELGLRLQTSYVGAQYVPHLSIFDRILLPKNMGTMMSTPPGGQRFRAGACHLVGELK